MPSGGNQLNGEGRRVREPRIEHVDPDNLTLHDKRSYMLNGGFTDDGSMWPESVEATFNFVRPERLAEGRRATWRHPPVNPPQPQAIISYYQRLSDETS